MDSRKDNKKEISGKSCQSRMGVARDVGGRDEGATRGSDGRSEPIEEERMSDGDRCGT